MPLISQAEIDHFAKYGYVLVRNLYPASALQPVREILQAAVEDLAQRARAQAWSDDEYRQLSFDQALTALPRDLVESWGRSWRKPLEHDAVWSLHEEPGLLDAMHRLLGPELAASPAFNARPKLPQQDKTVVPWHQDAGYYGEASRDNPAFTAWLPLLPVDAAMGCMQVVPGSHQRGFRQHEREDGPGQFLFIADDALSDDEIVTCEMQPGDALLMHHMVYHRSLPNISDKIRWSIDLRFYRVGQDPHPGTTKGRPVYALPQPVS